MEHPAICRRGHRRSAEVLSAWWPLTPKGLAGGDLDAFESGVHTCGYDYRVVRVEHIR